MMMTDFFLAEVDKTLRELAQATATAAQQLMQDDVSAPGEPPGVDTGALQRSITVQQVGHLRYVVAVGTEYAAYLEYGTSNMAARPFLLPAFKTIVKGIA